MAKKKIKADSVVGFWKRLSTIFSEYIKDNSCSDEKIICDEKQAEILNEVLEEINASGVPHSIASSFVAPFIHDEKVKLVFELPGDKEMFGPAKYIEEESKVIISPLDFLYFVRKVHSSEKYIQDNMEVREDVKIHRQYAFMKELAKMPPPYLIYIAVLQEIAIANDVVSIEHRNGGYIKSEAAFYLSLLWAFKEFEQFYLRMQHRSFRADYGVIWHEGEWVEERKTRGYV
jgi:hypothetical protein